MRAVPPCGGSLIGLVDLLAKPQHDELGRLERCEADQNIDDAVVDISLCGSAAVTLDEERVVGLTALESTGSELRQHEGSDVEPETGPQWLVVGFEHGPLDAVVDADPQEDGHPA